MVLLLRARAQRKGEEALGGGGGGGGGSYGPLVSYNCHPCRLLSCNKRSLYWGGVKLGDSRLVWGPLDLDMYVYLWIVFLLDKLICERV